MDRLQQLRHWMFARHAHPVSAWSRLLTTPLVVVPFWTRRADVGVGLLVWFAINPIMTPEPADRDSFATRAILGEERWVTHPELDRTMSAVNAVGFVALAEAILAARHRRKVPTILGLAASMAFTLYGWRRYADLYDGDQHSV
ncbi:DUF6653 family protein [Nocardia otitidiscaviarum]|uniref:DUF6653 family protein n=1 Tax=Nocardia otitidiscaviarum TaxID=1823 RepID=UPI001893EED1|nr:DUF6653 family protein [Nocardia otitidiscaviarum]MBF6236524.1 hypothetical protein [Nocardia otitidiscaviarum]